MYLPHTITILITLLLFINSSEGKPQGCSATCKQPLSLRTSIIQDSEPTDTGLLRARGSESTQLDPVALAIVRAVIRAERAVARCKQLYDKIARAIPIADWVVSDSQRRRDLALATWNEPTTGQRTAIKRLVLESVEKWRWRNYIRYISDRVRNIEQEASTNLRRAEAAARDGALILAQSWQRLAESEAFSAQDWTNKMDDYLWQVLPSVVALEPAMKNSWESYLRLAAQVAAENGFHAEIRPSKRQSGKKFEE